VAKGTKRRECEDAIERYKKLFPGQDDRAWHTDLRIQCGSPIAPRIASILEKLKSECGFVCWGVDRSPHERQVIEIFPSEAIWSLGLLSGFPSMKVCDVRSYKKKTPRSLVQDVALATALTPLLGFVECFGSQVVLPFRSWCEQVAEYACAIAADTRNSGAVRKDKGFDDPIESGLAFLTAVSFVAGFSHTWGDGSDGTIVGPGLLRGGAARRWSSTRRSKAAGSSR
jgi:hypothetical protein